MCSFSCIAYLWVYIACTHRADYEPSAPATVSLRTSCDVEYFAASHMFYQRSPRHTAFRNLHSSLNEVSRNESPWVTEDASYCFDMTILIQYNNMSCVMRKPAFAYAKTKTKISQRGSSAADQRLCFSTFLNPKFEASFCAGTNRQHGFCRTWSETLSQVLATRLI